MKPIMMITLICLLLTSCASETNDASGFINGTSYCQIGDTIYHNGVGNAVYHAGLDDAYILCHDPLCDHNTAGLCPEAAAFKGAPRYFQTNGQQLFMKVKNMRKSIGGKSVQEIYEIDPESGAMHLICDYEAEAYGAGNFHVFGDFLYYTVGRYKEEAQGETGNRDDMYLAVMRVEIQNGRTVSLFDEQLPIGTQFDLDDRFYYLIDAVSQRCVRIDKDTGDRESLAYDALESIDDVIYTNGYTVFVGSEKTVSVEYAEQHIYTPQTVLCPKTDQPDIILAENAGNIMVFDNAVWYSDFEITYHGSKEMPTGAGTETRRSDVITTTNSVLHRVDIATGEEQSWDMSCGDGYVTVRMMGISQGQAIISLTIIDEELNTSGEIQVVQLDDDGTYTVNKVYGNSNGGR